MGREDQAVSAVTTAEAIALLKKAKRTALEDKLRGQLCAYNLWPIRQFCFHPVRKWRSDFAFPDHRLLIEVDGGEWVNGAHNRGAGAARDNEKDHAAIRMGYRVLHFTGSQVRLGYAAREIAEALRGAV